MEPRTRSAFWGLILYVSGVTLNAIVTSLMRTMKDLQHSQSNAVIVLGEVICALPIIPVIANNWGLETVGEWISFTVLGFGGALQYIVYIYCAEHMPLGDFAVFGVAGVLLAPLVTLLLYRKCTDTADYVGVFLAFIGAVLVVQPNFLFGKISTSSGTPLAFFLACLNALYVMLFPFIIVHFLHIHWSNYIFTRTLSSAFLAPIYVTAAGDWALPEDATWRSFGVGLLIGLIITLMRLVFIMGCKELEGFEKGSSGIIVNVLNACGIPITAAFAYWFFFEVMNPLEMCGATIVFGSVVMVMSGKVIKQKIEARNESERAPILNS